MSTLVMSTMVWILISVSLFWVGYFVGHTRAVIEETRWLSRLQREETRDG